MNPGYQDISLKRTSVQSRQGVSRAVSSAPAVPEGDPGAARKVAALSKECKRGGLRQM